MKNYYTTHGLTNHPLYPTWRNMIARCHNPKNTAYRSYGGRGIMVCDRWQYVENFIEDMSPRPEGMTLDRRDVNLDYTPENCRWVSMQVQNSNRRDNWKIQLNDGRVVTACEAARVLGISDASVRERMERHGTIYATRKYVYKSKH